MALALKLQKEGKITTFKILFKALIKYKINKLTK